LVPWNCELDFPNFYSPRQIYVPVKDYSPQERKISSFHSFLGAPTTSVMTRTTSTTSTTCPSSHHHRPLLRNFTPLIFLFVLAAASSAASDSPGSNAWYKYWSDDEHLHYYHNPSTGETSWELASGAVILDPDDADGDDDDDDDDIVESNEDETDPDGDDNVLPDNLESRTHLQQLQERDLMSAQQLSEQAEKILAVEKTKNQLEDELAKLTKDGVTLEQETVDELMKKGGLLDADALLKLGLKVVQHLDEVYIDKSKGSRNAKKCGVQTLPCKNIQLGIDRASQVAKLYISGGYYAGPGNVNLRIDGRRIELYSKPPQQAIIDCRATSPLIDPLHSQGNTGVHDFQIQNCNIQDPKGRTLNGDIDSASIQLPSIRKVWDPQSHSFIPDPEQIAMLQQRNNMPPAYPRLTKKGKRRIQRNFFRI